MIDVVGLFEDLKKYVSVSDEFEQLFYDAPEGEAQVDIVKDMIRSLLNE